MLQHPDETNPLVWALLAITNLVVRSDERLIAVEDAQSDASEGEQVASFADDDSSDDDGEPSSPCQSCAAKRALKRGNR